MNRCFLVCVLLIQCDVASAQAPPGALLTPGKSFDLDDKVVSTSVFVWYQSTAGQLKGAWEPLRGRPSWTGEVPFWKDQVKQMMAANIDVLNVHLYKEPGGTGAATQRRKLFRALSDLRHEGYDVPKVTPFLDPIITWGLGTDRFSLRTEGGKDTFVNMYKSFYNQYYVVNTDPQADSYLTRIDNRTVLDTWHVHGTLRFYEDLTRADVQTRLQDEYGAAHPIFNDDIYMITVAGDNTFTFADEKVIQFQSQEYYDPTLFNGIEAVQLKPGYWDQNIRDPGFFLPRDGGSHFDTAWQQVVTNRDSVNRVYIESWNEYDESSGIYAAESQPPNIIDPPNDSGNTDTWSSSSNPFEYIETAAEGARQFNDTPDLDASILWHDFPQVMSPGEVINAQIIFRNTGDISWTGTEDYKLGQNEIIDPELFGPGRYTINDSTNEIPIYGGIFRGRPITFDLTLTAPTTPGAYATHWQMLQEFNTRFGEELTHTFYVSDPGDYDQDGDVDGGDFLYWQINDGSPAGLQLWQASFGAVTSSAAATLTGVPEPSTLLLSLLSLSAVGIRHRRKSKA